MKGVTTPEARVRNYSSLWICSAIVAGTLLLSGCGTKNNSPEDPLQKKWSHGESPLNADDGVTLTSAEIAALKSTAQVDKKLSDKGMADVTVQYKHYVRKGRVTIERSAKRAEKYLSHSRKVFKQRDLPEELAYLAIIESGYNPVVVSPAGAAGAWQFMPFTGTKYGLEQDWWMDERRDPYKSAEAAADYLHKLYGDFKDWHLAVAAYNAGEGKIGRALDKTGAVTFFKLTEKNHTLEEKAQLRDETKQYVPRFLAICKIMRNLDSLGFTPIDPNRAEVVVPITVRPGTDLMALSRAAGMEWQEFYSYNTAYKRYVSPTDRSTLVYVPQRYQQSAQAYLRNPRAQGYVGWKPYTVRKGDTWTTISKRSAVPANILLSANKGKNLKQGTVVLLPGSDSLRSMPAALPVAPTPEVADTTFASRDSKTNSRGKSIAATAGTGTSTVVAKRDAAKGSSNAVQQPATHTLQAGDTLLRVANLYNVSVSELMAANSVDDANRIRQGQVLRIPHGTNAQPAAVAVAKDKGPAKSAQAQSPSQVQGATGSLGRASAPARKKQVMYTVQAGDTLWGIAKKHNVQPSDLMQWNKSDGKSLRPGDNLVVQGTN